MSSRGRSFWNTFEERWKIADCHGATKFPAWARRNKLLLTTTFPTKAEVELGGNGSKVA